MKRIKTISCTLLFLFCVPTLVAQQLDELKTLLGESQKYYESLSEYSIEMSYEFYDLGVSKEPLQVMSGHTTKQGVNQYSLIDKTEMVFVDGIFVKVNHDERAVQIIEGNSSMMNTPFKMNALTGFFKSAEINQADGLIHCEVKFKELPGMPYSRMSMLLDASTKMILAQQIYMLPDQNQINGYPQSEPVKRGMIAMNFKNTKTLQAGSKDILLGDFVKQLSPLILAERLSAYSLY